MGGIRLPFLGANLPERNLTDSERKQIEIAFGDLYGDFTKMVSTARRIDLDTVRELGEGRVYLGRRASATRLVDRIGGLDDTIEAAKRAAGIPANRKVRVVEYPKPGLIRLPAFLGGAKIGGDSPFEALAGGKPLSYDARVLQEILDHPGQPLLLTPSEWLPAEEEALP
jgi:ClpP class serine protease